VQKISLLSEIKKQHEDNCFEFIQVLVYTFLPPISFELLIPGIFSYLCICLFFSMSY